MTSDFKKASSSRCSCAIWCRDTRGQAYGFEDFLKLITDFHGHPAPGLLLGGKMVDLAVAALPDGTVFDALAESGKCLPDVVQILTPCTIGNGWLKVLELGRFALALYDKYSGQGVRVFISSRQLSQWPQIDTWFFKRRPKAEQDSNALRHEIALAGERLFEL